LSEPTHAPSSGPPGKGQLSIPGIGKLPTWAVLAGVGVVLLLILRNRSAASSAASSPGSATSTDPAGNVGVIDPATGYVYGSTQDTAALQTSAAASTPDTSGTVDTSVSGQVSNGPPFTSNAAWSQYAISQLPGIDPTTLADELGLYLAGSPVTAAQETDVNAAVAVAGYPPVAGANGYPPAINVSGSKSGGGSGSSGSGPSSGSPGSSSSGGSASSPSSASTWQYPAPENLVAAAAGSGKIRVSWAPVVGPGGQRPGTYTVAYGRTEGAQTWKNTVSGTSTTLTTQSGMTEFIEVWADGGPIAPPHAGPIKATAGK
jgi:hypothetical protein